jgi:putative DNA primase/helicase
MPRVGDRSGATTRRITILPFNRTIPECDRDPELEQKLMAERSGILNECITYLIRITRQGGFDRCEQSESLMQEYIMENDTEATFLEERAERHESYKTRGGELYKAYSQWCIENGFKPKNSNQIAKEWRRLGFEYSRSAGSWWHGVRLRECESF